mmetsp:Transcript_81/g.175  ORF Transcript_81/g.175 Transcript_81/m.175 type:complete len:374 (-) Transcript_81:111-1232(-)
MLFCVFSVLLVSMSTCVFTSCEPLLVPPLIDISILLNTENAIISPEEVKIVQDSIGQACRTWGFFQVINHGLSLSELQDMQNMMSLFFNLPQEVKHAINVSRNNSRGYNGKELTKQKVDMKELFDVGHKPHPNLPDNHPFNRVIDGFNQWPPEEDLPGFRQVVESFYAKCSHLAQILMGAIAEDLNIPSSFFDEAFDSHTSFLRLNYYPVQEAADSSDAAAMGVSRHTDAGGLTILMQDFEGVSGLEVYSGSKEDNSDGRWVAVTPVSGALTINTGDMLQVWSNDVYKAPEHRVLPSLHQSRYSAPFFYNPNYATVIKPSIPSTMSHPTSMLYRPISWETFRKNRFLGDFENKGIETQIDDYKTGSSTTREDL